MGVTTREVKTARERREFVKLSYRLHRGQTLWVPPLVAHEKRFIDPVKNPHMAYSQTACYLARKNGAPAGKVMVLINRKLIERSKDEHARFCNFDTIDDPEVAHALLSAVENWAREQGMKRLVGPLGFSNQDSQGFIVEGFDERPSIGTIYNFEYVPRMLEAEGYSKEVDYVTLRIPIPETIPELYLKIAGRMENRMGVKILEFKSKREILPYLPRIFRFMNETYVNIYGFIPLSEEAIQRTVRNYREIVGPELVKIVVNSCGEIVGFIIGIKDITEGFKKAKGRLLPFGYFRIKSTQRKSRRLDLLLGAVKEEYRNKGLTTMLAISMIRSAHKLGLDYADSHHELETNTLVQAEMKRLGGVIYKRHRVFQKAL
jgi:GNAT superfamily N-acetyltransferase